jgi:hypothetical protein
MDLAGISGRWSCNRFSRKWLFGVIESSCLGGPKWGKIDFCYCWYQGNRLFFRFSQHLSNYVVSRASSRKADSRIILDKQTRWKKYLGRIPINFWIGIQRIQYFLAIDIRQINDAVQPKSIIIFEENEKRIGAQSKQKIKKWMIEEINIITYAFNDTYNRNPNYPHWKNRSCSRKNSYS